MTLSRAAAAAAEAVMAQETAAAGVPEAAWGILADGRLVSARGAERIFRTASITKSFTAAATLGVVRGLIPARTLRLEDRIVDWLPELLGSRAPADAPPGSPAPGHTAQPSHTVPPDSPAPAEHWAAGMTVGDLLTMSSGLPTDDPWADRQESMPAEDFRRLLGTAALTEFPAGTAYRYSNYGYALLGLIVERASGRPYPELVRTVFLEPLGMASSGFDVRELPADRLAVGYRRDAAGALIAQPPTHPGAFSAIGGLASTVEDLAVWVGAYIDAAHPSNPERPAEAFRRIGGDDAWAWQRVFADQQQSVRPMDVTLGRAPGPAGPEDYAVMAGYGCGLRAYFDTRYGHSAGHSGGYPGFGLHMRWHAASRSAVILFTALTGFPAETVTAAALAAALDVERRQGRLASLWPTAEPAPTLPSARTGPTGTPSPATAPDAPHPHSIPDAPGPDSTPTTPRPGSAQGAQRPAVFAVGPVCQAAPSAAAQQLAHTAETMIATGDTSAADAVFSMNMDLDVPRAERCEQWAAARAHTGESAAEAGAGHVQWRSATVATWTVCGPRGKRTVTMTLNPFERIQSLRIALD